MSTLYRSGRYSLVGKSALGRRKRRKSIKSAIMALFSANWKRENCNIDLAKRESYASYIKFYQILKNFGRGRGGARGRRDVCGTNTLWYAQKSENALWQAENLQKAGSWHFSEKREIKSEKTHSEPTIPYIPAIRFLVFFQRNSYFRLRA